MLTLSLPPPLQGDDELQFAVAAANSEETRRAMVTTRAVFPEGLAYVERMALLVQLQHEESRRQQLHADPSLAQLYHDHAQTRSADEGNAEGEDESYHRYQSSKKKKFVKLSDDDLLIDWYDVLKLEQQDSATEEQIRNAYRRRCLETHPDKQRDHSDELFKKVQKAFDILGDPEVRLTYDSSRPFDDAIPEETLGDNDFYATFGPVFERNKKWSRDSGLPSLGNDALPIKEVVRFYDRWNAYQSWRDFSHAADLEEIHEDMPREEKRFYLRENERQLSQFKREEQKRIRALVDRARKNDPRLQRQRQEEDDKRRREIEEREAFRAKLLSEQQQRRMEQEEKERAKKDEERRAAQEIKDAMRQAQADVVALFASNNLLDKASSNKLFCTVVRHANITWLFSKINNLPDAQKVSARLQGLSTARVPRHSTKLDPAIAAIATADEDEKEEVEAVLVFNAIVHEREGEVGFTRYGDSIKKVTTEKKSAAATAVAAPSVPEPEWTEDDLHRLQKATAKYPPGTIERWSKIAVAVRNRFTEEQAMAKVNELQHALAAGGAAAPAASAGGAAGAATAGSPSAADAAAAAAAAAAAPIEEWTVKQQKQLEQGLRELKDYKDKDKFQKIAKMVEGKTAKECFDRFKFLCSVNKKK